MAVVLMYRGERNFAASFHPVKVCSKLVVDQGGDRSVDTCPKSVIDGFLPIGKPL